MGDTASFAPPAHDHAQAPTPRHSSPVAIATATTYPHLQSQAHPPPTAQPGTVARLPHSVFDIPELLLPICSHLSSHDILQCILVSHRFHALCIPILYSSISILSAFQFYRFRSPAAQLALARYASFVRVFKTQYYNVLPCFLNPSVDCSNLTRIEFPRACRFSDPVVPRGYCPQAVENVDRIVDGDHASVFSHQQHDLTNMVEKNAATRLTDMKNGEARARSVLGIFDETILIALMEKCPRLSVLSVVGFPFDNDLLIRQIADRLTISTTGLRTLALTNLHFCRLKASSIEYLLNHCTPEIEELLLCISYGSRAEVVDQEVVQEESMDGAGQGSTKSIDTRIGSYPDDTVWNLKMLSLKGDLTGSGTLSWLPLLRRSTWLRSIHMDLFTEHAMDQLACTLSQYCPKVTDMTVRCSTASPQEDDRIADLIRSSSAWTHLSMSFFHGFGPFSTAALLKHSATLETLVLEECDGFCSEDIQRVLSSCPNLRTFRAMTSSGRDFSSTVYLDASEMVDSPWVCHRLENLKIIITGIARPDLRFDQYGEPLTGPLHDGTIQGFDLQRIVYQQLGKLTRLQELWLGHDKQDLDDEDNYHRTEVEGQWKFIDPDEQFECLEFSLRSGLDLLSGLKDLRTLNLDRLQTRIGLSEVQWMAQQWPRLERVIGLVVVQGDQVPKHVQWLYDNHPHIVLPPVLGNFFTSFS
ncbi:hypothetical protein EC968_005487 [Mortierella alpina]|nr:hypothetical protein EC968_005487 [Mortierella alpina]